MQTLMAKPQSEAMQLFRDRVRRILEARHITIKDLADTAGTNRPYLSKVLSGRHDPTIPFAEEVAKALGVNLVELLSPEKNSKKSA